MSRDAKHYTIFDGAVSDLNSGLDSVSGEAYGILASDFKNAVFTVSTSDNANLTLLVKGTTLNQTQNIEDIDFASAASRTNPYKTVQVVDLEDGVPVNGSTGVAYAGVDETFSLEVNINALDLLQFEIESYVAGTVNLGITLTE